MIERLHVSAIKYGLLMSVFLSVWTYIMYMYRCFWHIKLWFMQILAEDIKNVCSKMRIAEAGICFTITPPTGIVLNWLRYQSLE